jgi:hypothetical protein
MILIWLWNCVLSSISQKWRKHQFKLNIIPADIFHNQINFKTTIVPNKCPITIRKHTLNTRMSMQARICKNIMFLCQADTSKQRTRVWSCCNFYNLSHYTFLAIKNRTKKYTLPMRTIPWPTSEYTAYSIIF